MTTVDDGSLAFLNIKPDETNLQYNCKETTQQQLINTTFWVCGRITGVKTKYGEARYLVLIKFNKDDTMSEARKFFTNSKDIKYIVDQIAKLNAFPRKVTMRANGTRYYFE
jgi:hypothetical protein